MGVDLEAIEAAARRATSGPWCVHYGRQQRALPHIRTVDGKYIMENGRGVRSNCDASFIATANPAAILAMCEEVRRLREVEEAAMNVCTCLGSENMQRPSHTFGRIKKLADLIMPPAAPGGGR